VPAGAEHVGGSPWMTASLNHNMMPMDQLMQMPR